ncbi:MAG: porphobilinogen synthase [Planctomycetota bacterium]|nr:porphobilinogen synthase [Planctomycetota bacterium]
MAFPAERPRRLRRTEALRSLIRETGLGPSNLIAPFFVSEREDRREVGSMPGVFQLPVEAAAEEAARLCALGIPAAILFGIPARKDAEGSGAWDDDGVVQRALRAIRKACPDMALIADACFCEYTDHGHCGVLRGREVDNDATLANLRKTAVSLARAGADIVAPSCMMDGMVAAMREALNAGGFAGTAIMSYAVKYASAFYGPFREAAESAPAFGDRRGYQMDPANAREALREARLDASEGADIILVKPALSCLDIIYAVSRRLDLPVAAYNVSGEYSMIKAAARLGWLDERKAAMEMLTAIKRAGASMIITYWAADVCRWLGGT